MEGLSDKNFGLLVAYVLPGFVTVNGFAAVSPTVAQWVASPPNPPSMGGFLYVAMASLGTGLIVSAVRWAVLDTIHHHSGNRAPNWDFSRLQENLEAFNALVISHYRYYQFYANMFVAIPIWFACRQLDTKTPPLDWPFLFALLAMEFVLFAGSRDALRKYHERSQQLLRDNQRRILVIER